MRWRSAKRWPLESDRCTRAVLRYVDCHLQPGEICTRRSGCASPLVLVAVDLPDDATIDAPDLATLPQGWDALPMSSQAQAFGGAWLAACKALGMLVPSVLVREESNMILNPRHPACARVTLSILRPFAFDQRMFK